VRSEYNQITRSGGFVCKGKDTMRIAFMGTPEFAVPTLNALIGAGHDVVAVYTQPPRPAGRGKKLSQSAVHMRAQELGLHICTLHSLKTVEEQTAFSALNLDVAVVAAYGLILPTAILEAPHHGCLNVHGSLLPRWRGAAPVQRAILAGDAETGVMVMQMEVGLDTGPVRASARTAVMRKTASELTAELAQMGAGLMLQVLTDMAQYPAIAQGDDGVTYAAKIDKTETRLDFTQSAEQVERQVRAFYPTAWFAYNGERYRVLAADVFREFHHPSEDGNDESGVILDTTLNIACGSGAIKPTLIQRAGKPVMPLTEFLRGNRIPSGTKL
jgi:methionyl-tRNA formyltransferase